MTVIVTDAKYRASLAAARSLSKYGHDVVLTQTSADAERIIPSFYSVYASRKVSFSCSSDDEDKYFEALAGLIKEYSFPVLFPIGAKTLSLIAKRRADFEKICRFAVSPAELLDFANDKARVLEAAVKAGINIPYTYTPGEVPRTYPVIVKPRCGEKFGLKASERYVIAENRGDFETAYKRMEAYGGSPVVQQMLRGTGIGVSLLMGENGAVSAMCHRRIREYPCTGGPSTCCESFYDEALVAQTERLLKSIGFYGMAMVEYKLSSADISCNNAYLLEINPRVWGSFPLTYASQASFADDYVRLSCSQSITHGLNNYLTGVRMNFVLSDAAAVLSLISKGKLRRAAEGIRDILTGSAREAMWEKRDNKPFWRYIMLKLFKG